MSVGFAKSKRKNDLKQERERKGKRLMRARLILNNRRECKTGSLVACPSAELGED